jgi:hypothetical protein
MSSRALAATGTWIPSGAPNIQTYLLSTPKDTLVAGVVLEIDNVPAFGSRSVLGSMELLVPYKKTYYAEAAHRMSTVALALYAPSAGGFAALVDRYGVDYILVERVQSTEPAQLAALARNFPQVEPAARFVEGGGEPFFRARLDRCTRASGGNLVLADASCVLDASGRE